MRPEHHIKKKTKRRGKAFMLYLSKDQAGRLDLVSRERHVPKAEVVRLALSRLLKQLSDGEADLRLGI